MAKYRSDVIMVFSSCDLETQRAQMEKEDSFSFLRDAKEKIENRDIRIKSLLKVEGKFKEAQKTLKELNGDINK